LGIGTPVPVPVSSVDPINEPPADPEAVAFFSAIDAPEAATLTSSEASIQSEAIVPSDTATSGIAQRDSITLDPPHNPESLTDARTRPA
jgi:hypothetical protein